jgi:DNA invertase Pin-like site-specific DNA recombinase
MLGPMANSLVIRRGTNLTKRSKALRAAQYVRMSTDKQKYSIENQRTAIATFALEKSLTIVRTYMDEGRSGLRIKGRTGLIELINDVCSGNTDFDHILVYDVSRWGRFQDVDEAAYYEFICKLNGIRVEYCAEEFENDGSFWSSIGKCLKRGMAGEWSRELSVKVHAGQCRVFGLGYRVGGPIGFGLRRELVDEHRRSKGFLTKGQNKALQTDRVLVRLGSKQEADTIRWIFHQFVLEQKSDCQIARELNAAKVFCQDDGAWTDAIVHGILKNENYIGNLVHNRTSVRLGQKRTHNPANIWIRRDSALDPIVDRSLFIKAQKIMAGRYVKLPDDQMLQRLRVLLARRGALSANIIDETLGVSSSFTYVEHFGSLRNAYALIGYKGMRNCDWIDKMEHWSEVRATHAKQVASALGINKRTSATIGEDRSLLTVNGKTKILFVTSRQEAIRGPNHSPRWRVSQTQKACDLLAVLRLGNGNKEIKDYWLLPRSKIKRAYLRISDASAVEGATRVETLEGLIATIRKHFQRSSMRHVGSR